MLRSHDKVLFIGDSITHAHRRPEEHHDCYYLGGGYANLVAGSLGATFPELPLTFINRGECGQGVRDLANRWERDCLALGPHLISILIGINDANPGIKPPQTSAEFEERYIGLLSAVRERLPGTRVMVLEPFALSVAGLPEPPVPTIVSGQLEDLRPRQALVRKIAASLGAVFVPLQDAFDAGARRAPASHWTLDGVHPSAAGHQLIARRWLAAASAAGLVPA